MWVPPFFTCGACGGEIGRWPVTNLLRQEVLDWRHRTIPQGATEHRAVLGTPAHTPRIPVSGDQAKLDTRAEPVPAPVVPATPADLSHMPGPAVRLTRKAEAHGWTWRAVYMHGPLMTASWQFVRMVESVVIQFRRDGHRLVAGWQTKAGEDDWKFDQAWSLTHFTEALTSPELNAAVTAPRMICGDCGETRALHITLDNGPPVCFATWDADRRRAP